MSAGANPRRLPHNNEKDTSGLLPLENARELDSYSPRLSCGAPRLASRRYTRPGKKLLRFDLRQPPRARSSPRSLGAKPLSACVRDTELLAPDSGHASDRGIVKRVMKGVATDHSGRAHDYNSCGSHGRNVQRREALIEDTRFVAVMTMRAPPASRRRAGAPQTATSRPS